MGDVQDAWKSMTVSLSLEADRIVSSSAAVVTSTGVGIVDDRSAWMVVVAVWMRARGERRWDVLQLSQAIIIHRTCPTSALRSLFRQQPFSPNSARLAPNPTLYLTASRPQDEPRSLLNVSKTKVKVEASQAQKTESVKSGNPRIVFHPGASLDVVLPEFIPF